MAVFNKYSHKCSRLDWAVLINGSISLYYKDEILNKDLEWLKRNYYQEILMDFSQICSEKEFHRTIKKMLNFPAYYGENMSALSDCLLYNLNVPDEGGLVIVLKKFHILYEANESLAHEILERLDEASRRHLLSGERLITFVQSDLPQLSINLIGGYKVMWNRDEFIDSERVAE